MIEPADTTVDRASRVWRGFLQRVRDRVSEHVLQTWLRPVRCLEVGDDRVVLEVRDTFFRDWLNDHYLDFIRDGLNSELGGPVAIEWSINPDMVCPEDEEEAHAGNTEKAEPGDDVAGNGGPAHVGLDANVEASADRNAQGHAAGHAGSRAAGTGKMGSQSNASDGDDADINGLVAAAGRAVGGDEEDGHLRLDTAAGKGTRRVRGKRGGGASAVSKVDVQAKDDENDAPSPYRSQLNDRFVFNDYVCGPSNQLAFAASKAVSENPGESYNPLFLFGGVGLGKTHLLCAVGHRVLDRNPKARVLYTSAEQFTNEVVNAVLGSKLDEFRARYRQNCDLLLIDDIQLIAGKDRTQHEFFHVFNSLYDSQRQIVVTSDKLPHEIPDIEDRLRSRFQWGLIADIQAPEIETRIAILRKKAETEGVELDDNVIHFLAKSIFSNVRELEGAFVRLLAHASLSGTPITVSYAREALADILSSRAASLSVDGILRTVANHYQVRLMDIKGRARLKTVVRPRQVAMYLCRRHTTASFPAIGKYFGRDHSTILSAVGKIETSLKKDAELRHQVLEIERELDLLPS